MTNPPSATMHTDFQFHWSYAKIGLQNWCKKMRGFFDTVKIPFNFFPFNFRRSCDQPPQSRTLIFSFISAKLKINCLLGVKKIRVIKSRKVSVSGENRWESGTVLAILDIFFCPFLPKPFQVPSKKATVTDFVTNLFFCSFFCEHNFFFLFF